jgi:hypothetical protein
MWQARDKYIEQLASDYGIEEEIVWALSEILGENEDQDGLISALEDIAIGGILNEN